jgi:UDP-2,3-diacylglucosamine pyrophosphatase LpxH
MTTLVSLETTLRCRTVFISDVHLGFHGCSADFLNHFLDRVQCDTLYLVGDIIDFWYLRKKRSWPPEHGEVIYRILDKARNGTRVVFVPGNHDEAVRPFNGMMFGCIEIQDKVIHETADGQTFLVLHGDQFDSVVRCSRWLAKLGSWVYDLLLRLNTVLNRGRRLLGREYWSLAAFLKHRVKNAVSYISSFEEAVVKAAAEEGVDGVVCGHIHRAEISRMNDLLYMNCGDWVESCTALIERPDGTMELLEWRDRARRLKVHRQHAQGELWEDLAA